MIRKPVYKLWLIGIVFAIVAIAVQCNGQTIRYWIQPGGHQHGLTAAEQERRIVDGMSQFAIVADLQFVQTKDKKRARIQFYFATEKELNGNFGWMWPNGVCWLNRTRVVRFDNPNNWLVQNNVIHETGHANILRRALDGSGNVDQWRHSKENGSVFNNRLNAKWFTPTDVIGLQKKFGKPKSKFWPRDKSIAGEKVRRLTSEWKALRDARTAEMDKVKRAKLDKKTKAKYAEYMKAYQAWKKLKNKWQSVPLAA